MPYLNWKNASIRQEMGPHPRLQSQLTLTLGLSERSELHARLSEVLIAEGGELRLDLPSNWAIFWKSRESESRLLLAHPQTDEWVATVALHPDHGSALLRALEACKSGESISIGELDAVGSVSNVEIVISLSQ